MISRSDLSGQIVELQKKVNPMLHQGHIFKANITVSQPYHHHHHKSPLMPQFASIVIVIVITITITITITVTISIDCCRSCSSNWPSSLLSWRRSSGRSSTKMSGVRVGDDKDDDHEEEENQNNISQHATLVKQILF